MPAVPQHILDQLPALADISLPTHLKIKITPTLENLMSEVGRLSMAGYAGQPFFGTAFVKGNRLQFTCAMPVDLMLKYTKIDRSSKQANIREVTGRSNRPEEPRHAKLLREYLFTTACQGDQFILPSFTFNYGVGL